MLKGFKAITDITVAVTPIIMNCFKKLILYPNETSPRSQAYRANRYMDDTILNALHKALTHLEQLFTAISVIYVIFIYFAYVLRV